MRCVGQLLWARMAATIAGMDELIGPLESIGSPRVLLVGDFMLDRYVYGDAERLSPEAPVPVLHASRHETRTGGAGNVAAAILALGAEVTCVGVIGQDEAGEELAGMLAELGAKTSSLTKLGRHRTTVKTRFVGLAQHRHPQQMLRVDEEITDPLGDAVHDALQAAMLDQLGECDIVAFEDYDKGLLTGANTPQLIAAAREASKPVVVDPACVEDFSRYRGATVLTPNRYEAALASGIDISDDASLCRAAGKIIEVADAEAVVITLDKEGACLVGRSGEMKRLPTRPRAVYDVAGAGDEVLAVLAVALAGGVDLEHAVALANVAGALEVERFGVVAITRGEIVDELRRMVGLRGGKVLDRRPLSAELTRRRDRGETVVFTNGCFDLLHMGHVRYLQQARHLGSCLVVAINSDASAARLKGPGRPVIGRDERAEMLAALECVDYVTIFDEDTPHALLELLRPDVLVKGGTTPEIVGREVVEAHGGKVMTMDLVEGLSTTAIINRILDGGSGNQ